MMNLEFAGQFIGINYEESVIYQNNYTYFFLGDERTNFFEFGSVRLWTVKEITINPTVITLGKYCVVNATIDASTAWDQLEIECLTHIDYNLDNFNSQIFQEPRHFLTNREYHSLPFPIHHLDMLKMNNQKFELFKNEIIITAGTIRGEKMLSFIN